MVALPVSATQLSFTAGLQFEFLLWFSFYALQSLSDFPGAPPGHLSEEERKPGTWSHSCFTSGYQEFSLKKSSIANEK